MRRSRKLAIALLALGAPLALAAARPRFPVAPPPAHTGGFGEPTCEACHMGNPQNDPAGAVELRGVPQAGYEPGRAYRVTVHVRRPGMAAGGFEIAARGTAGADSGQGAGTWRALDDRVAITTHRGVAYAHHTELGAAPSADSASWTLEWTAPAAPGRVVFHVAANAANGDRSQFDDYVYALGLERAGAVPR